MTNKQIVEDFLHFLNTKNGIINTDNYTYSYQELRNALIEYHKESAAADTEKDLQAKLDFQTKLVEWSKQMNNNEFTYAVALQNPEEMLAITKEQIEEFKEELEQYQKKTAFCIECGREVEYQVDWEGVATSTPRGVIHYKELYAICPHCDNEVYVSEINDENVNRRNRAFQKLGYSRCNKCIHQMHCPRDKDYDGKCPDYRRDAPDGGFYG